MAINWDTISAKKHHAWNPHAITSSLSLSLTFFLFRSLWFLALAFATWNELAGPTVGSHDVNRDPVTSQSMENTGKHGTLVPILL